MDESFPATQPEDLPSETAAEDLPVFWQEQGVPPGLELQRDHLVLLANLVIDQRLAPLKTKGQNMERDKAVMTLGELVPESEQEKTIAVEGAAKKINIAHHTKNGEPIKAVRNTYEAIVGYLQDAYRELDVLDRAVINPSGEDPETDPELVRRLLKEDSEFREVYSNIFYCKERLDHYDWSRKQEITSRKHFFTGMALAVADYAYDTRIENMHDTLSLYVINRANFWAGQVNEVHKLPFVREALASSDYVPPSLLAPRRLLKAEQVDRSEDQPSEPSANIAEPNSSTSAVSLAGQVSDREQHRIDTMIHQGVSPDVARRRVLGPKAPKHSEERVEVRKILEKYHAAKLHKPRQAKPKPRFYGRAGDVADGGEARSKTERFLRDEDS